MPELYIGDIGLVRQAIDRSGLTQAPWSKAYNDVYPVQGGYRRRLKVYVMDSEFDAQDAFLRIKRAFTGRFINVKAECGNNHFTRTTKITVTLSV